MQKLGQYYTANIFSQLLVNSLTSSSPRAVLELGVGEGSLLKAAYSRWADALYYVSDIDNHSLKKLQNELPFINSFHLDVIKENLLEKIKLDKSTIDIAICNPPYLRINKLKDYNQLFEDAKLRDCKDLLYLTSDIIFLAKSLQILRTSGELGIILPDGLITSSDFRNFRSALINAHNVKAIIQLPEKIFKKTEALTHIIIIEKEGVTLDSVPLYLADVNGKVIEQIGTDKSSLFERMDFKYHSWKKKSNTLSNSINLKSIGVEVKRGLNTHKDLKSLASPFLHTTNIVHENSDFVVEHVDSKENFLYASKGDILLSRVGVIGKATMLAEGRVPISDCLYRIRVPENYRMRVWNALISAEGQAWLKANSHGVCAQVTSKIDLLNFPITLTD